MPDPTVHTIEGIVLTIVTAGMVFAFVIFLLATWTDRPYEVGRYEDGRPRPVRPVQHQKGTR